MKTYLSILFFLVSGLSWSQDTFSIVAIDTVTGEIGSAGASCIDETAIAGGAIIISDILPGRGAIHTQSYWSATNQQNAHARMEEGMSPQEIIDWLVANDVSGNPGVRQYGIVDTDSSGQPRSAAFTGANCLNYKNHITGPNYSIQGNILLGQEILDDMEFLFLNTEGSLAEKLMSALQGANVVGADTRCMNNGTSSLSAFIRVARPDDVPGDFYCDLNVPSVPAGMEPIDSLQTLFDAWLETTVGITDRETEPGFVIYPNPAGEYVMVSGQWPAVGVHQSMKLQICNQYGQIIMEQALYNFSNSATRINLSNFPGGIYTIKIQSESSYIETKKLIIQ